MDQTFPKPALFLRGLLTAAVALALLPGCSWFKDRLSTTSKIPTDPERKQLASSQTGQKAVVAPSSPVTLDGSATGNGTPDIPNAPNVTNAIGPQAAGGLASGDPAAGLPSLPDDQELTDRATPQSGDGPVGDGPFGKGPVAAQAAGNAPDRQGPVVVASSVDRKGAVVTADGSGGQDLAAIDTPKNSKADESLVNENSNLEFEGAGVKLKNGQVAATVNGQPIFVEDIMRQLPLPVIDHLARAEREATPQQYRDIRRRMIAVNLEPHIERELLLQALKSKLKEDQLKSIVHQIDKTYNDEYLAFAMKQAGVETAAEFEALLRKQGSSIDVMRTQFRNKELAHQYLGSKALPKAGFDRPDVLKYYQEHKENYAIPATAKWEQIRLSYANNGGKEGASKMAEKVLERLENGEEFATLAKACSDGPTAASRGGMRAWTTLGTLKDKELERALYEQPVGEIGQPIETESSIEIIRVIERTPKGYTPFPMVQDDIKTQIKNELMQKSTKALIKDLRDKATIEPLLDKL